MTRMNFLTLVAIVVVSFFIGYFVGKQKTIIKEVVRYEKREPIKGGVPINLLKPATVFDGVLSDLPNYYLKYDTLLINDTITVHSSLDTARLIYEHLKLREYDITLFDDKINGRLSVQSTVQYNMMTSLNYDFTPIQKVVTRTVEKKFIPFVSANYSTNNTVGVGGGAFVGNLGVEVLFNKSMTNTVENLSYTTFGLKYKF